MKDKSQSQVVLQTIGQTIVLTGSSSGIGEYLKKTLVSKGHRVFGLSRREGCDINSESDLQRAVGNLKRDGIQQIDSLICAAGVHGPVGPAMSINPDEWIKGVVDNLGGTFRTLQAFYPLLKNKETGHAKVVLFSGGGATGPRVEFSAYAAAKTAIVRLCETLAEEWKSENIDINSVAPGAIATRLIDEILALGPDKVNPAEYESATKIKKTGGGSLEKVGGLIDYLIGQESDGVSGKLFAAQWDPWDKPTELRSKFNEVKDFYTLRRIT